VHSTGCIFVVVEYVFVPARLKFENVNTDAIIKTTGLNRIMQEACGGALRPGLRSFIIPVNTFKKILIMKTDLTKYYKSYYTANTRPELVTVEAAQYLSLTGKGDPSAPDYAARLQALYATAYALKFMYKAKALDFTVAKLEGLWWFDEKQYGDVKIQEAPRKIPRSEWEYRLLIRLPDFVREADVWTAKEAAFQKKGIAGIQEVTFYEMEEGKVVQMLHVGPFDTEPETLLEMKAFMDEHHFQRNGKHHEIYLSDFRKTPPAKLKTILREPVK